MQYVQKSFIFIILAVLISCGGEKVIRDEEEVIVPVSPMAILTSLGSTPENGDGLIKISGITSNVEPSGGDQVIRINGVTGEEDDRILHQIDVHYYIYYVGGETKGAITMVTHSWGSTLSFSIDGGISICEADCNGTEIHPALNTLIFANQTLNTTANLNTLQGTVVYPDQSAAVVE